MAKEGSLFTFLAGAAIGAALVWLNTTEKGRAVAKEGEKVARKYYDEFRGGDTASQEDAEDQEA